MSVFKLVSSKVLRVNPKQSIQIKCIGETLAYLTDSMRNNTFIANDDISSINFSKNRLKSIVKSGLIWIETVMIRQNRQNGVRLLPI